MAEVGAEVRGLVELACELAAHERDPDAEGWQDRLDARADELAGAVEVLLDAGEHAEAVRLVGALSWFCQDTGRVTEGRELTERVVRAAGDAGSDHERARAWLTLGELAFRQGDQAVALEATGEALGHARAAGDDRLELRTEMNLARVAFRDGDAERIHRHADRMDVLAGDDPGARFGAVHMRAWAEHTAGDVEAAIALFEENVGNARAAGNRTGEASELLNLASLALEAEQLDRAESSLHGALDIADDLGSSYLLPGVLTEVGRLMVLRGGTAAGLRLIAAGEHAYELAGLAPDPGDDAFLAQRAEAVDRLGPEQAEAELSAGRGLDLRSAIDLARTQLADTARGVSRPTIRSAGAC